MIKLPCVSNNIKHCKYRKSLHFTIDKNNLNSEPTCFRQLLLLLHGMEVCALQSVHGICSEPWLQWSYSWHTKKHCSNHFVLIICLILIKFVVAWSIFLRYHSFHDLWSLLIFRLWHACQSLCFSNSLKLWTDLKFLRMKVWL